MLAPTSLTSVCVCGVRNCKVPPIWPRKSWLEMEWSARFDKARACHTHSTQFIYKWEISSFTTDRSGHCDVPCSECLLYLVSVCVIRSELWFQHSLCSLHYAALHPTTHIYLLTSRRTMDGGNGMHRSRELFVHCFNQWMGEQKKTKGNERKKNTPRIVYILCALRCHCHCHPPKMHRAFLVFCVRE